ncbi:type II toxin-antitoxin system VapC family toxin [Nocardiopsis sp. CNT-189]|uniref:type II toxin-antitoxin system VapC family toxin n=1 Tax=Nocardiopsis oceanisediminis TaxID=2816862 RepID=UPI003B3B901B
MIVLDNSAAVRMPTSSDPGAHELLRRVAGEDVLCAPHLVDTESMSAVLGLRTGGKITGSDADAAVADFRELPIERYEVLPLWPRLKVLRSNLSAYDAAYVALAEALDVPMITADARMARSGAARCPLEVFGWHGRSLTGPARLVRCGTVPLRRRRGGSASGRGQSFFAVFLSARLSWADM